MRKPVPHCAATLHSHATHGQQRTNDLRLSTVHCRLSTIAQECFVSRCVLPFRLCLRTQRCAKAHPDAHDIALRSRATCHTQAMPMTVDRLLFTVDCQLSTIAQDLRFFASQTLSNVSFPLRLPFRCVFAHYVGFNLGQVYFGQYCGQWFVFNYGATK